MAKRPPAAAFTATRPRHEHFICTKASPGTCPRCRRPILTATAEGLPARVDATPLDPAGELAALLAGLHTYTHTRWGELVYRDASRIRGRYLQGPTHAEHRCPPQPIQQELF